MRRNQHRSHRCSSFSVLAWAACFAISSSVSVSMAAQWRSLGPAPITSGPFTGRVSSLAVSAIDPNLYFAGAADGGVWRTDDGGTTWTPLTDDLPRTAIGALALDPQDESIIYAGSGEANFANHSRYGVGLYKSTDGGDTWSVLAADVFAGRAFSRLLIDPNDTATLYASITHAGGFPARVAARGHPQDDGPLGVFKSTDGGVTWVHLLNGLPDLDATDVAIDPVNSSVLYAAIGHIFGDPDNGVYKSTDAGASWSKLSGGLPNSGIGRISIAVAPTDPSRLYANYVNASDSRGGGSSTRNIYRSDNGGTTWTATNPGNFQASYGWYLSTVLVHPTDANTVFAGGLNLIRSTNGGGSWVGVTPSHVDIHALAFDASGRFIAGDDGGVHRSTNNGNNWTARNDTLSLVQFYAGITLNRDDPNFVLGGTQDNGTNRRDGDTTNWSHRMGGDGGWTSNHPDVPDRYFAEFQGTGNLYRSTNRAGSFSWTGSGISGGDRNAFLPPHVIDPTDPNRMLYGTHRIYRSTNGGSSWSAISGDLTGGSPAAIRSLAIAPSNGQTVFAATNDGRVQVSRNGGSAWDLVLSDIPGWPRVTKEVAIDPLNDAIAYLAVSWFDTDQIRMTRDYGATWEAIDGDLPDVPVNTVAVQHIGGLTSVFLGTDEGVYRSVNRGRHWSRYGVSLPNTPIVDLLVDADNGRLVAATEGRGVWEIELPPFGDADDDSDVDLFDVGGFLMCVGGPDSLPATPACLEVYDFDGDLDVDFLDFGYLVLVFTGG